MDPTYDWREGPVLNGEALERLIARVETSLIDRIDAVLSRLDRLEAALQAGAVGSWSQPSYPREP